MEKHFVATCYPVFSGKVAMLFHRKLNMWLPPGGHIEENELPSEAVHREMMEEANLRVEIISDLIGNFKDDDVMEEPLPFRVQEEYITDKMGDHKHLDLIYVARVKEDTLEKNDESRKIRWFSEEELDNLEDIRENTRQLAKLAIEIEKRKRSLGFQLKP